MRRGDRTKPIRLSRARDRPCTSRRESRPRPTARREISGAVMPPSMARDGARPNSSSVLGLSVRGLAASQIEIAEPKRSAIEARRIGSRRSSSSFGVDDGRSRARRVVESETDPSLRDWSAAIERSRKHVWCALRAGESSSKDIGSATVVIGSARDVEGEVPSARARVGGSSIAIRIADSSSRGCPAHSSAIRRAWASPSRCAKCSAILERVSPRT